MNPTTLNMLFSIGISVIQAIRAERSDNPNSAVNVDLRKQFNMNARALSDELDSDIQAELERRKSQG